MSAASELLWPLKLAATLLRTKVRETLRDVIFRLRDHQSLQDAVNVVVRWPIAEEVEAGHTGGRLKLHLQTMKPLHSAAFARLLPFLLRKCINEVHRWHIRAAERRLEDKSRREKRDNRKEYGWRVAEMVSRRGVREAWVTWGRKSKEEKEGLKTRLAHRLTALKRTLLSHYHRTHLSLCSAFAHLKFLPRPSPRIPSFRKALLSACQRQRLSLLSIFLSLKPSKLVPKAVHPVYTQSIPALVNLLSYLMATRVYIPGLTALSQKEAETAPTPCLSPTHEPNDNHKVGLKLGHFERQIRLVMDGGRRWAMHKLTLVLPKYQRKRFYRLQKGLKAFRAASVLAIENEVFQLLQFLLYSQSRFAARPLIAFPRKAVVECQRLARGFLARRITKRLREMKRYREMSQIRSVITAQSLVRGFLARRLSAHLRNGDSSPCKFILSTSVLNSRVFPLIRVFQRPLKRQLASVFGRLPLNPLKTHIHKCILLQRGAKDLQRVVQSLAFRSISAYSG